jgi:hypothetical protein
MVKSVLFAGIGYKYKLKDIPKLYGLNPIVFKASDVIITLGISKGIGLLSINVCPDVYNCFL